MFKEGSLSYIRNLANMASAYASGLGGAVIEADEFEAKNYLRDFAERYQIPPEMLRPVIAEHGVREQLRRWICGEGEGKGKAKDRFIAKVFGGLLRRTLGEEKELIELSGKEELLEKLGSAEGERPSCTVQDLCFVRYKEGTLCLMLGRGAR